MSALVSDTSTPNRFIITFLITLYTRLRKVDFVLAVGICVGFGPELGSEKQSENEQKVVFYAFYKPNLPIINRDMSVYYS